MYEAIIELMRRAARDDRVYLTVHANKELKADGLQFEDVRHCILTGEIVEQQFDDEHGEEKYVVYGDSLADDEMALVAKLGYNADTIIITVFRLRIEDYDS